ncbi:MAG: hypothetical protein WCE61_11775 [Candidatus Acidiferrum sp.]
MDTITASILTDIRSVERTNCMGLLESPACEQVVGNHWNAQDPDFYVLFGNVLHGESQSQGMVFNLPGLYDLQRKGMSAGGVWLRSAAVRILSVVASDFTGERAKAVE